MRTIRTSRMVVIEGKDGADAAMVYLPRNSDGTIDKRTREFKKLLKEGKCTRENS